MSSRDPVERFGAYAVITVGALVLGLAGLCTGALAVTAVISGLKSGGDLGPSPVSSLLTLVLTLGLFGGIPMMIGFLTLRWGRRLLGPWTRALGVSPARTTAAWVMVTFGAAIVLATIGAAIASVILTRPFSSDTSYEHSYDRLFLFLAGFLLAIVSPVGPWLLIEGYRLTPLKPPPSGSPPS